MKPAAVDVLESFIQDTRAERREFPCCPNVKARLILETVYWRRKLRLARTK